MMDWTTIITAVLSAVAGGGGGWWLTAKQQRKRADAEAESVEIDALRSSIASLTDRVERQDKRIAELDTLTADLQEKLMDKRAENLLASSSACFHFGCVLRKPILGCGKDWLEKYRGNFEKLVDYLSVEELMRQYRKPKLPKDEVGIPIERPEEAKPDEEKTEEKTEEKGDE